MSSRRFAVIKESVESAALETQQMDVAEAENEYNEGVEVEETAAREELAVAGLAASMPTASMEAMPKELRNGMRVRFSHGHGKIARIYTAPFFLDKKHHKASKETPIYLVKHDKGGKHSLHKASALRPA
jgi:hypothetical protein